MKVFIKNQQRLIKINQQKIKSDSMKVLRLSGLKGAELSILLVNDRRMKALNSLYRGVDKTTDVLSFPQLSSKVLSSASRLRRQKFKSSKVALPLLNYRTPALVLGDIVINLQAAKRQAPEHRLSFNEELRWLLVHGILHLIGYDHEKNKYAARKMLIKERELLEKLQKASLFET